MPFGIVACTFCDNLNVLEIAIIIIRSLLNLIVDIPIWHWGDVFLKLSAGQLLVLIYCSSGPSRKGQKINNLLTSSVRSLQGNLRPWPWCTCIERAVASPLVKIHEGCSTGVVHGPGGCPCFVYVHVLVWYYHILFHNNEDYWMSFEKIQQQQ